MTSGRSEAMSPTFPSPQAPHPNSTLVQPTLSDSRFNSLHQASSQALLNTTFTGGKLKGKQVHSTPFPTEDPSQGPALESGSSTLRLRHPCPTFPASIGQFPQPNGIVPGAWKSVRLITPKDFIIIGLTTNTSGTPHPSSNRRTRHPCGLGEHDAGFERTCRPIPRPAQHLLPTSRQTRHHQGVHG